ncbi:helix-turn-helix domain-containing protein [Kribbella solani]|uniref:helix-turn-helix transcriptional regulator n=1 Tax=Kribbella solani TaxID=236067 RepID=UPI0029AE40DE|nr:helix-turn-helix domain-containing protein [Kribbella solani]MDX3006724.1 helix-turn-helix domain-containing protein [Kribbella solani]
MTPIHSWAEGQKILTIAEVSELTRTPAATLRFWRSRGGRGPKSFKVGPKRVGYLESDVLAWLEEQYQAANEESA